MGIQYNPLSGLGLDIVGTSGGGGPSTITPYSQDFIVADWTLSGSDYIITVTAATHGLGVNPAVEVMELIGSVYHGTITPFSFDVSGNIILAVNSSPDERFNGKLVVY